MQPFDWATSLPMIGTILGILGSLGVFIFGMKVMSESLQKRMQQSGEAIKAEMLHVDILNNMESMGNHSLNILQALRQAD